jgi:GntR family transcriptional regulator/MocR family aminotransferase
MQETPGHPDPRTFPFEVWGRLQQRIWRNPPEDLLWCHDPSGYLPLRRALADHLRVTRLLQCEPEQVVITTGMKQNVDLVGRLLLDVGDRAIAEDPGFTWFVVDSLGIGVVRAPVDEEGLDILEAERLAPDAKLAIVTPSHQCPLGSTMSLQRRIEMLRWAERRNAWILEDDYDSEFKYSGSPVAALQGLDGGHRVIYAGTFSKALFSTLRLGFLVLPPGIVDAFVRARRGIDTCPSILAQPVMAAFISEGHFGAHIRTMRQVYRRRHQALLAAVSANAAHLFMPVDSVTGLTIALQTAPSLATKMSDRRLAQLAVGAGLHASPLSGYCYDKAALHGLMVGLGTENESELTSGVAKLTLAIDGELT